MGSCLLWEYYYRYCSKIGTPPHLVIVWLVYGISCTATTFIFLSLLYIAEGWGVLKKRLDQSQLIWSLCAFFWVASILMYLYPSFVFVLVFFYLLILRHIFQAHSRTMAVLKNQYEALERAYPMEVSRSPIA